MLKWIGVVCVVLSACSLSNQHKDNDIDAGGPDAQIDAQIDAAIDSGHDAPPACVGMFDAIDDRCERDDDCALAVQTDCLYAGSGRSRALGIARTALGEFARLEQLCDLPRADNVSQRCPGEGGGLAPVYTDDQTARSSDLPMAVRCDAGRCVTLRTSCGPALCGNGALDGCAISDSVNGPVYTPAEITDSPTPREACDGDLLSQSCQDVGYGSGQVSCIAHACMVDDRQCQPCAEISSNGLPACVSDVNDGVTTEGAVLATSASEVALLWTTYDGSTSTRHVWLARFNRQLTLLSKRELPADVLRSNSLALGAMPDGWLVTSGFTDWSSGEGRDRLELHALNAQGDYDRLVETIPDASRGMLVPRPGAMPLLIHTLITPTNATVHVRTLSSELSASEPVLLGEGDVTSAVFVGDGYLVVLNDGAPTATMTTLHRVELDGAVSNVPSTFEPGDQFAALSNNGARTLLTFRRGFDVHVRQLDSNGGQTAQTTDLVFEGSEVGDTVFTAFDEGALLLRAQSGASNRITATRMALDGSLSESIEIGRHPGASAVSMVLVDGSDAFVLFVGGGYNASSPFASREQMLSLARVTPFD